MKSQQDFQTLNEYRDYLRDYYVGEMLPIVFKDAPRDNSRVEIILRTRQYAGDMVIELYGDWT